MMLSVPKWVGSLSQLSKLSRKSPGQGGRTFPSQVEAMIFKPYPGGAWKNHTGMPVVPKMDSIDQNQSTWIILIAGSL